MKFNCFVLLLFLLSCGDRVSFNKENANEFTKEQKIDSVVEINNFNVFGLKKDSKGGVKAKIYYINSKIFVIKLSYKYSKEIEISNINCIGNYYISRSKSGDGAGLVRCFMDSAIYIYSTWTPDTLLKLYFIQVVNNNSSKTFLFRDAIINSSEFANPYVYINKNRGKLISLEIEDTVSIKERLFKITKSIDFINHKSKIDSTLINYNQYGIWKY